MIINTRPYARSSALNKCLQSESIDCPVLETHALPWSDQHLEEADAIVVTSQTAIEVAANLVPLSDIPVYAVGSATARAALQAGFQNVAHANGTAVGLLGLIGDAEFKAGAYLSACHVSCDLAIHIPERLTRYIVYEMRPASTLPTPATNLIESGDPFVVPFYSPRTLEVFERLVRHGHLQNHLSLATAVLIHPRLKQSMSLTWGKVLTAERPDNDSVVNTIQLVA